MQENKFPDLFETINTASDVVVVLVLSDGCENFKSQVAIDFEDRISKQPIPVHLTVPVSHSCDDRRRERASRPILHRRRRALGRHG